MTHLQVLRDLAELFNNSIPTAPKILNHPKIIVNKNNAIVNNNSTITPITPTIPHIIPYGEEDF